MLPEDRSRELENLAAQLLATSNQLTASIHPILRRTLGDLVRSMNCYYSNLIEGHHTHPVDINRALAGVSVKYEPTSLADQRFVRELISFHDPAGNRLEAFYGASLASEPFRPGRSISGFRTGVEGMGHVVLMVANFEASLTFYKELLGFQISDFMTAPKICFLHANTRHHSLALFESPRQGMHHLLVELYSLDDVGQGYDIARAQADRVKVSLGRHSNDYVTSFYMQTPSNFLIEYGWGGRELDVATWQPLEMSTAESFWGHDGLKQSVLGDAPFPENAPPAGRRAPLQVMGGNYERLRGVCPWWDAMTAER